MSIQQDRVSIRRLLSDMRKSASVDIQGIDLLYDRLERIVGSVAAENLKPVFFEAGKALRDRAKANAPYDKNRKRGHHLRDAIFVAPGLKGEPNVLVGVSRSRRKRGAPSAPHGILVEYGTSKMAARPFFRPAIAQTSGAMRTIIADGIEKTIGDATK